MPFHTPTADDLLGGSVRSRVIALGVLLIATAVADVFDALTTDRPYRRKVTCEAAREQILQEAGKEFDPSVVEAFLRISCDEWDRIARRVAERRWPPSRIA